MAVMGERITLAVLSLAACLPGGYVLIKLALWSSVVGDLLYWGDLDLRDLIFHPLQSGRAIVRGIADDAGTIFLFLFYGAVVVVPVWLLLSFVGRRGARSSARPPAKLQPTS
ncbi:hypothetical protein [Bradyrhizobium retamae]|nr:hypothetical protein [Bradyrhizobium retamae]